VAFRNCHLSASFFFVMFSQGPRFPLTSLLAWGVSFSAFLGPCPGLSLAIILEVFAVSLRFFLFRFRPLGTGQSSSSVCSRYKTSLLLSRDCSLTFFPPSSDFLGLCPFFPFSSSGLFVPYLLSPPWDTIRVSLLFIFPSRNDF